VAIPGRPIWRGMGLSMQSGNAQPIASGARKSPAGAGQCTLKDVRQRSDDGGINCCRAQSFQRKKGPARGEASQVMPKEIRTPASSRRPTEMLSRASTLVYGRAASRFRSIPDNHERGVDREIAGNVGKSPHRCGARASERVRPDLEAAPAPMGRRQRRPPPARSSARSRPW
jgi:hypothetical protein